MLSFKLDSHDRRILALLDINSRINLSELSRKLKRSKQFILFRMHRLENQGIITGYRAIVDMSKLGYFTFRVYLKCQQFTIEDAKRLIDYVKSNSPQVWSITTMHGKWDYALFIGVKNINELHACWDKLLLEFKQNIKLYDLAVYAPIYSFNRKHFEKESTIVQRTYGIGKEEEIDNLDMRILETFAGNVRQSSLEIAKKLKVSSDTVRKRINTLEKKKIIVGYKLGLNLKELGYESYRVDFQLISTKRNAEILEYCKQHKHIYQINKTIGGADLEIEVSTRNINELITLVDEMKQRYKNVISDADFFAFSTYSLLKYIPD